MAKLFFENSGCLGATSGVSGREYTADRQGFIHVSDSADVKNLKSGGYIEAGGMPRVSRYYVCACGWEALIKHCPKCDSDELEMIES